MKRFLLSGIVAAMAFGCMNAALTTSFYGAQSVLNSGKWVKIGVEKTGVYEISYQTLKEMGFSDPSKVSIYGRGGRVLPESFSSPAGQVIQTDDLGEIKVLHENGKLYFYGLGPEEISFVSHSDYKTGGYFSRKSNNIYTRRGYYFLTDSRTPSLMETQDHSTASAQKIDKGISYLYHEIDSVQNTTQSGQLFWGESLNLPGATKRCWDVTMPDAIEGDGVMECVLYISDTDDFNNANIVFGFDGHSPFTALFQKTGQLYYLPFKNSTASIDVPGQTGRVTVGIEGASDMGDYANLDFWVVSYQRQMPSMKGVDGQKLNQQLLALPSIEKSSTGIIELSNPASLIALDVTSENDPKRLNLTQSGSIGTVAVKNSGKVPVIVVFDTTQPQLQISGFESDYSAVANQNLHALKQQGADFIIITTPMFKEYAEEIARLHREHDGIEVVVATTEECYNEFSGGTPDPMAYRSFARMLYFGEKQPKNMLLLGPLYGDFRGLKSEHNPLEGIIAYQSPSISTSRGAHNINDFYGMMGDEFRTDYYERNPVQIGVGILPLKFESEAKIVVEKIKNYLERDDHAYFLNKYTAIGGLGDQHTHDTQIKDIDGTIRNFDYHGTILTPLAIDTYGNAEARKKFLNQINEGCSFFSYFGHGAEQFLGKDNKFFNAGDVYSLRNKTLPFALFGGCQITNTDRGFRGLGETIVTATPYGCIGSIVSARETWSGQNLEFFKQFFKDLYNISGTNNNNNKHRQDPVTIGEVYAAVKHNSTYSNELAYQLLCDPALVIPIINRSIESSVSDVKPGEKLTVTGSVIKELRDDSNSGNVEKICDTNFNGEVVIRLNEPERTIGAGNIETKEDPKDLAFTYRDNQITMATGEVKEGKFTLDVIVPSSIGSFEGEKALLYISVYDKSTKVGGAGCFGLTVGNTAGETTESKDRQAPRIDRLEFNEEDCSISLAVSDNYSLNLSNSPLNKGLHLYIDGTERTEVHFVKPMLEMNGTGMSYSKDVYIEGLSYGEHSARLKVKDLAGNSAEQEILFTYNPLQAKYTIAKDNVNSSADVTYINIEGQVPSTYHFIVLNSCGQEIFRSEPNLSGNVITWHHNNLENNKVEKGHYKAYILETGSGVRKGHSEPIDINVI